ncbi:MAG: hypothetical protein ABI674_04650 [Spartobacteria bacterium]
MPEDLGKGHVKLGRADGLPPRPLKKRPAFAKEGRVERPSCPYFSLTKDEK